MQMGWQREKPEIAGEEELWRLVVRGNPLLNSPQRVGHPQVHDYPQVHDCGALEKETKEEAAEMSQQPRKFMRSK
jgi:hypothetical protein